MGTPCPPVHIYLHTAANKRQRQRDEKLTLYTHEKIRVINNGEQILKHYTHSKSSNKQIIAETNKIVHIDNS